MRIRRGKYQLPPKHTINIDSGVWPASARATDWPHLCLARVTEFRNLSRVPSFANRVQDSTRQAKGSCDPVGEFLKPFIIGPNRILIPQGEWHDDGQEPKRSGVPLTGRPLQFATLSAAPKTAHPFSLCATNARISHSFSYSCTLFQKTALSHPFES